jgi:ABC-type glucose/galactose transport system permease subunit
LAAKCSRAICGVLGGHADARALAHGGGVVEVGAHGHAHAALGDLQVQRLVQAAAAAVLQQRVLAGHAQVGAAVLHVGGHVGGAHQHHAHVAVGGPMMSLRALLGVFQHLDAGGASSGRVSSKMRPLDRPA